MQPILELNDGRLYDLLEAGGEQARISVRLLARLVAEGPQAQALMIEPLDRSAKIADEVRTHLVHAIVASLPKEDVEALSRALADMTQAAGRFAGRFGLAAERPQGVDFGPALAWAEELSEVVLDMLRQLRGFESLDRIKDLHPRLQTVADHAETLTQEIVNRSYQQPATPVEVMLVKDLGEQLCKVIDRGREAGDLMNKISFQFL